MTVPSSSLPAPVAAPAATQATGRRSLTAGNTVLAVALLLAGIAPVLPWFSAPVVGSINLFQGYQLSELSHQLDGSRPAASPWWDPAWAPVVPMALSLLALAALGLLRRKPISARVTVVVLMVLPGAYYGWLVFRLASVSSLAEFMGFAGVGVYAAVAGVLVSVVVALGGIVTVGRTKRVKAFPQNGDSVTSEGNPRAPDSEENLAPISVRQASGVDALIVGRDLNQFPDQPPDVGTQAPVSPAQGNWPHIPPQPTHAPPADVVNTKIYTDGLKDLSAAARKLHDFGGGWPNLKCAITNAVPAMNAALMAMQAAQPYLSGEAKTIAGRATHKAQQMVAALESAQGWLATDNYVNANLSMDAYSSAAQACNGYVGEWYAKVRPGNLSQRS